MIRTISVTVLLTLALSALALAAGHPELNELTPLLSRSIDSDEVQALVKKYHLTKTYKFDSGSFTPDDQAYRLMFRENRIRIIILRASPWPKGYGDANWTTYSHPLPRDLKATDGRNEVETKLGKPTKPGGDRWADQTLELWVRFDDNEKCIEEIWLSAAQAR